MKYLALAVLMLVFAAVAIPFHAEAAQEKVPPTVHKKAASPVSRQLSSAGAATGQEFDANESVAVKVTGHANIPVATFHAGVDGLEQVSPAEGRHLHVVTATFRTKSGRHALLPLKLADIVLHNSAGHVWPAKAISFRGSFDKSEDFQFYRSICAKDQSEGTLDFGVGFTGMDMTSQESRPFGAGVTNPALPCIEIFHGRPTTSVTFLFELPQDAHPSKVQFKDNYVILITDTPQK